MRVQYRLSALDDLAGIYTHINTVNPQAARRVVGRLRQAISRLEMFPNSGRRGVIAETSELVVPGLPYVVVYVIEPEFLDIVAVYHTAQDR